MRSVTVNTLLAFVAQASTKELTTNHTTNAQNSTSNLVDKLITKELVVLNQTVDAQDSMDVVVYTQIDKLLDLRRAEGPLNHADLDKTMLGKPGRLAILAECKIIPCTRPVMQDNPTFCGTMIFRNMHRSDSTFCGAVTSRNTQVIIDIDDTVKSSGGVKLAGIALGGIDTQYRRGTFYPGMFRFVLAIAKANNPNPLHVAVLTARAKELKWALQLKKTHPICRAFEKTGRAAGFPNWGIKNVLYGSVNEWVFQKRKGWRKFENFKILADQVPLGEDRRYFFVGDTGELDREAAAQISMAYPSLLQCIFLHVVSEMDDPPIPPDELINGVPVLYFRTYVGAARKAAENAFISQYDLPALILQAAEDLRGQWRAPMSGWRDLERDISLTRHSFPEINIPPMEELMGDVSLTPQSFPELSMPMEELMRWFEPNNRDLLGEQSELIFAHHLLMFVGYLFRPVELG